MSALLLAPYNDSMRLGAGYNSFLQTPCLGNAVVITDTPVTTLATDNKSGTSQTVAYSASFVEKMSEVVRSMNISAGSSIRTGSVNTSAGSSSIDEAKFAESDLNAVLSVKVVNQTRTVQDKVKFNPVDMKNMNSELFHNTYGDTFISGFIEGGELHGIVSIKILEASRKTEIKKQLKSQFNGNSSEWSPTSAGELSSVMSQTEVTITVNYSGGGMVKDPSQEWTLDSLMATASAFPDNVASCPQRTSAILSRYNTVPSFVEWMNTITPAIQVRRYEGVQRYTSELLDTFIEYKSNLLLLNNAIRHPEQYRPSSVEDAVPVDLKTMVNERRMLKAQMERMVHRIELLDKDPGSINSLKLEDEIPAPELHRARLPMRKDLDEEANLMKSLFDGLNMFEGSADSGNPNNTSDPRAQLERDLKLEEEKEGVLKEAQQKQAEAEKVLRDSHAGEIAKLKKEYAEGSEKLKKEHAAQLQEARTNYENMKSAKETAENSLRTMENDLNVSKAQHQHYMDLWNSVPEINLISIMIEKNGVGDHLLNQDLNSIITHRIRDRTRIQLGNTCCGGYDP